MWHFLSDKDIAELYDIPAKKVKNRRHDFNIKPVTSAIDRIERELYGRKDWLEEELKSVLPFEYNNGNIPHTNSTPLNSEKEFLYMKATGDVCERCRWQMKRAIRSGSGRRLASGDSPRRQSRAPQQGL